MAPLISKVASKTRFLNPASKTRFLNPAEIYFSRTREKQVLSMGETFDVNFFSVLVLFLIIRRKSLFKKTIHILINQLV